MTSLLRYLPSFLPRSSSRAHTCTIRFVSSAAARLKFEELDKTYLDDNQDKRSSRYRLQGMDGVPTANLALIKDFVKNAKYLEGWDVFMSIPSPNAFECTAVLNLCARASWPDRAIDLWAKMPVTSKDVVAYSAMIDLYARCRRPNAAESLFLEMESAEEVTPNLITYTSMISALGNAGRPDKAMVYFQRIPPDLLSQASGSAKQRVYNILMSGFARSGNYAKTREIFIDMTSNGVETNITHFNTILTSCAKDANSDLAQGVFDLISKYNLSPSLQTWTILLSCNRYNLARCLDIISHIRNAGLAPSGLTLLELLSAHVLAQDWSGAKQLIGDLDKFGGWRDSTKLRRLTAEVEQATRA